LKGTIVEGCFASADWAIKKHACCVVDEAGRMIEGRRYRHDEHGIGSVCRRLVDLRELVAVERPDRLLIERLLGCGRRVVAIHPNRVAAMRDETLPSRKFRLRG
jgi:transposase